MKEVKSALPVEEESSEGEVDGDGDGEAAPKPCSSAPETNSTDQVAAEVAIASPVVSNREEEMKRLQMLLKEKERQLKEQERLRKLSERRSQDIFQIESTEKPSLPPMPESAPPLPLPPPPIVIETLEPEPKCIIGSQETKDILIPEEIKIVASGTTTVQKKDEVDVKVKSLSADDLLKEISETEIIDLTEDAPKISGKSPIPLKPT